MSVSIQSETSKDEIETEDAELEDLVWSLMSRSGLLPQIQGQIAKFIEDNGKADNVHIYPERADRKILGLIFEYLQWIGMKQTNSVLLSEAPVDIDLSFIKSNASDLDYKPELYKILEDHNETEDRGTPTRSQNYSKDEFEDSRLTSASGRHSVRSEDDEIENVASEEDEEEAVSNDGSRKESSLNKEEITEENNSEKSSLPKRLINVSNEKGDGSNDLLINFDSPVAVKTGRSFDLQRPNVTVRQRLDPPDPFQSPIANIIDRDESSNGPLRDSMIPSLANVAGDSRESFVDPFGPHEIINKKEEKMDVNMTEVGALELGEKKEEKSVQHRDQTSKSAEKMDPVQKKNGQTSPDDESTSDFMETLTIEEDTQDVSIPSDEKGMSSCEHAVSLN